MLKRKLFNTKGAGSLDSFLEAIYNEGSNVHAYVHPKDKALEKAQQFTHPGEAELTLTMLSMRIG
eukprot:1139618-Pelagomonas_calceolata.AAC.2